MLSLEPDYLGLGSRPKCTTNWLILPPSRQGCFWGVGDSFRSFPEEADAYPDFWGGQDSSHMENKHKNQSLRTKRTKKKLRKFNAFLHLYTRTILISC